MVNITLIGIQFCHCLFTMELCDMDVVDQGPHESTINRPHENSHGDISMQSVHYSKISIHMYISKSGTQVE